MTDRLGPKRTLNLVLFAWMAIFTGAGAIGIVGLPLWCCSWWRRWRPVLDRRHLGGGSTVHAAADAPRRGSASSTGCTGWWDAFRRSPGPIIWASVTALTIHARRARAAYRPGHRRARAAVVDRGCLFHPAPGFRCAPLMERIGKVTGHGWPTQASASSGEIEPVGTEKHVRGKRI